MSNENLYIELPDGDFMNFHRNITISGKRGCGGACIYSGEDAEVLRLLKKHTQLERRDL